MLYNTIQHLKGAVQTTSTVVQWFANVLMCYQFTCEVVNKFKDSQKINIDRLMGLKILCSHKRILL